MKKGLTLVLFLFAFAILSFGFGSAVANCSDTDGGMNYIVKGTVTTNANSSGNSSSFTDYCYSSVGLGEYTCTLLNASGYNLTGVNCQAQYGSNWSCSDGKCVQSCTPLTCNSLGKQCGSWSNGCGGTLNCGTCSSGSSCNVNGQCVANNQSNSTVCTDSDGGMNYFFQGSIAVDYGNGSTRAYTDYCGNSVYLNEYACTSSNIYGYNLTSVNCQTHAGPGWSCSTGKCIQNNQTQDTTPPVLTVNNYFVTTNPNGGQYGTVNTTSFDSESLVSSVSIIGPFPSTTLRNTVSCSSNPCLSYFGFQYVSGIDGNGGIYSVKSTNSVGLSSYANVTFNFAPPSPPFCTDSDGGWNYNVKGTVVNNYGNSTDFCVDGFKLLEYACSNASALQQANYTCSYGCAVGACITKTPVKCSVFKKIFKPSACADAAYAGINAQVVKDSGSTRCGIVPRLFGKCKIANSAAAQGQDYK